MLDPKEQSQRTAGSGISALLAGRRKLVIGVILVVIALGYFTYDAMESAAVYYLTVGEALEQWSANEGETFRVNGKLLPDTYQREQGSTVAHFSITDGQQNMQATYDGVVSDLFFNDHSEIILEGQFSPDGVFKTDAVLVKCPSKYIPVEETA